MRGSFLSERFLEYGINQIKYKHLKKIYKAHFNLTDGFISGEIRLAIILQLLSGALYLDLVLLFMTSYASIYHIFHHVIEKWICKDDIISINFYNNLNDIDTRKKSAQEFAANSRNEENFSCIIRAHGGWLIRIKYPTLKDNAVKNRGSFYCRKGFYAVNIKPMVDSNKLIVWRLIKCQGSKHNSTAFKCSKLYKLLTQKTFELLQLGLCIIRDSAYAI